MAPIIKAYLDTLLSSTVGLLREPVELPHVFDTFKRPDAYLRPLHGEQGRYSFYMDYAIQ